MEPFNLAFVVNNYTTNRWLEFLDKWYTSNNEDRIRAVKEYPFTKSTLPITTQSFIAASVDYLCNKYNIDQPEWVYKDEFVLKHPYFAADAKGDLRIYLLQMSPKEFRTRHVYVDEDPLSRC